MAHSFDDALALSPEDKDERRARFSGTTPQAYQNMIGPFGGVSAALLAQGMKMSARDDLELVSITTDFMTGLQAGPYSLSSICHRSGRSTQFWAANIQQEGTSSPALRGTAIFGERRRTAEWTEGAMPDAPAPEACDAFKPPRTWAEHISIKPCLNTDIFNASSTRNALWVKFTEPRPLDDVGLVCLADTPTPRVFFVVHDFAVLSTVSMTVYLHASKDDLAEAGPDWIMMDANAGRGGGGFYDQHTRIWSRAGKLLATTQQMVWYKAPPEATKA
ncbi:acyl-CoA thioesterase [Hyphobacterium sp.]|uniref:acyl-CoA thioesterase n=1 Tax=Hyphobacterium sp. TaxID=2004662 RepID=UPI003B525BE2